MTMLDILLIGLSAALAVGTAWLLLDRSWASAEKATALARVRDLENDLAEAAELRSRTEARAAELDAKVRQLELDAARLLEKSASIERAREEDAQKLKQLREAFDHMAGEALDKSTQRFLELAKQTFDKHREASGKDVDERRAAVEKLIAPIAESLKKTDEQLKKIDAERLKTSAAMQEKFELDERQRLALALETRRLSDALRKPEVRGRYGEIQLQRVAEISGMASYCDFDTQHTLRDGAGKSLRPDMVVRLPNDRVVVVDAKANIEPYLRALEAEGEDQEALLEKFADGIAKQARDLARKEYWAQFDASPEFVVMFVPGDQFVDAALSRRPALIEEIAQHGVILASPSTLIGLLRAVHVGWREKAVSESARELLSLGRELHERSAVLVEHVAKVGRGLNSALNSYNNLVGSIDNRLLPTLRKFEEAGAGSAKPLNDAPSIEVRARRLGTTASFSAAEDQANP